MLSRSQTALFVPGDRPERYAKAVASGADVVIVDLEDAVALSAKHSALDHVVDALAGGRLSAAVRINPVGSPTHEHEVSALLEASVGGNLLGLVLPKSEDSDEIAGLAASVGGLAVVPLIESARGLRSAPAIAAVPGVARLAFGAIDFSLDIAADAPSILDFARFELAVASAAAQLPPPIDTPSIEIVDMLQVESEARQAKRFGFGGKLCIHPAQVDAVRQAFRPTVDELAWAQRVVDAEVGGVAQIDGQMIDRPVVLRAQRIMEAASR